MVEGVSFRISPGGGDRVLACATATQGMARIFILPCECGCGFGVKVLLIMGMGCSTIMSAPFAFTKDFRHAG